MMTQNSLRSLRFCSLKIVKVRTQRMVTLIQLYTHMLLLYLNQIVLIILLLVFVKLFLLKYCSSLINTMPLKYDRLLKLFHLKRILF